MNTLDYIAAEQYHQVMMYDPAKERADELATQLLIAELKIKSANQSAEDWKKAYYKLESILYNQI